MYSPVMSKMPFSLAAAFCCSSWLGVQDLGSGGHADLVGDFSSSSSCTHQQAWHIPECVDCSHWHGLVCSFQLEPGICLCLFPP